MDAGGGGLGGFQWTAEEASTIGGIATVSLLHSFIPTHWLPFSIVGRAQRWPLSRTLLVTAFGAVLHVVSTALLGITAVTMANTIAGEETVHKLASLLLIFLGAGYILLFALGKGGHSHAHNHPMEKMAVAGLVLVPALSPCATTLPVFLAVGNSSSMMILAIIVLLFRCDSAVVSGFLLMFIACIVWLKLVSFAHTNHDIRQLTMGGKKVDNAPSTADMEDLQAPTLGTLIYFMMAPTLCYQPSYPRTSHVRKGWLIRQIILYLIFTGIQGFIIEQYINPIVVNSEHPLKGGLLNAVETVLRLSLPNVYLWLCMFYCFFHLWLNILAEILRFGDREFYKDWWNAKTIDEYWRKWNMPVHKWIVRHIYFPCMRSGISKEVAVFVSFFVSAVLHELCVAVPCRIVKFWAFLGIMLQIPLITLTSYLKSKFSDTMAGNMIFWFFFCIYGQPMCVLLYYHDVMNRIGKTA